MNLKTKSLYFINCIFVLIIISNNINITRTFQLPSLQHIRSYLFYKTLGLTNQKHYNNARKSTSNLLSNELVVIEKKIKENLLDRLKNFHASTMKLR
jgi:hypothetical protein